MCREHLETAHGEMSKSGYWLISGLIIFMILEKLFPENEDEVSLFYTIKFLLLQSNLA